MRVQFANGDRSWEESADLSRLLADTLTGLSHKFTSRGEWLELPNGMLLVPQVVQVTPSDDGKKMQTISTIQVSHPKWVPKGVFEYQHSWGPDVRNSFSQGFTQWAQVDLPVFLYSAGDKCRRRVNHSGTPGREGSSIFPPNRRVILGPTSHLVNQPATEPRNTASAPAACSPARWMPSSDLIRRMNSSESACSRGDLRTARRSRRIVASMEWISPRRSRD